MGISLSIKGDSEIIKLGEYSIMDTTFKYSSQDSSLAKLNTNSCTLFVKCMIENSNNTLKELENWAHKCRSKKDCYRNVEIVQTYAEKFYRKITLKYAYLEFFKEIFYTDNSKFMEVELSIIQKESKLDEIKIQYS